MEFQCAPGHRHRHPFTLPDLIYSYKMVCLRSPLLTRLTKNTYHEMLQGLIDDAKLGLQDEEESYLPWTSSQVPFELVGRRVSMSILFVLKKL